MRRGENEKKGGGRNFLSKLKTLISTVQSMVSEKEIRGGINSPVNGSLWLFVVWIFHVLLLIQWGIRDRLPFGGWEAEMLARTIGTGGSSFEVPSPYPLYSFLIRVLADFAELKYALMSVNALFSGLAAFFVYMLVRKGRSGSAALLAGCFVLCNPFVMGASRHFSPWLAL